MSCVYVVLYRYVYVELLKMSLLIDDKGFKFVMLNVRSLYSSVDEIAVKFGNVDVIALCETWLNDSYTDEMLDIPNFTIFRLDRNSGNIRNSRNNLKRGGGLLFYVSNKHSDYISIISNCSKVTYNLEQLWICLRKPNVRNAIFGVVYRPPTAKVDETINELNNSMEFVRSLSNVEIILAGDLNINYNLRHSRSFELLKNFERKYNLNQLIKAPTRIVEGSKSLIDLIFTDVEFIHRSGVVDTDISDHQPIFLVKKKERISKDFKYITGRSYSRYDKEIFQEDILHHGLWDMYWNMNTNDLELLWSYMLHIITEIADIHCPIRKMKISNDNPHWMSKEIIESIHNKDMLYKIAKQTGVEEDLELYKVSKKEVKFMVSNAKEEYIKDQLEQSKNNPRKFWRNINEMSGLGKSRNKSKIGKLIDEEGKEYENQSAADFLNDFYTNAGPLLAEQFSDNWRSQESDINVEVKFSFSPISEFQVKKIIQDIKIFKSCAIDNMSSRLLKDAFMVLIPEITYLFNRCIELGDIPQSWCHGFISPIPKTKNNSTKPKDWRPITQIPLLGKLLEKLIHEQVYSYFNNNHLLSPHQYGFRPGMSTSQAIFDVLKILYSNWNDKVYTGCIFVDYSRAFETIDHNILISKLKLYGFDDISLNFFRNYITHRTQSTNVDGHVSGKSEVVYGTAQGSVLGPLIYIIYVNDVLKIASNDTRIIMYADDMLIINQNAEMSGMRLELQRSLNTIIRWCNYNKLTINKDKTKYMLVSNKRSEEECSITIGDRTLCKVSQYEYLGVTIDSELKMNSQVDSMYKKANTKLGILSKIRRYITEETAVKVYKIMIRPYLEYIDFVIESSTKEKIDRIDNLQRKALRRIEYCNNPEERKTYEELGGIYKIEKLCVRRKRSLLRMMYIASKDINNIKEESHGRNLRSSKKVKLKDEFSDMTKLHKSPYFRGLRLWELLPDEVQKSESIEIFKNHVKKVII